MTIERLKKTSAIKWFLWSTSKTICQKDRVVHQHNPIEFYDEWQAAKTGIFNDSLSRPIQPEVIKVHLASAAVDRHVDMCTKTNSDTVNIGQNQALIFKILQGNNPLCPGIDLSRIGIIVVRIIGG